MTCALPVVLREAAEQDLRFVYDSWWGSHQASTGISLDNRELWHQIRRAHVLVAAFAEDQEYIMGWAASGPKALLYVYVRESKRQNGLARLLVETLGFAEPLPVASWSQTAEAIAIRHPMNYRPYLSGLMEKKHAAA